MQVNCFTANSQFIYLLVEKYIIFLYCVIDSIRRVENENSVISNRKDGC